MLSRMPAVCGMMQVLLRVRGKPGQDVEAPSKGSCHLLPRRGKRRPLYARDQIIQLRVHVPHVTFQASEYVQYR